MEDKLTILIPTIGRESIANVLEDISQEDSVLIIILAHGKHAFSKVNKYATPGLVQVVECDEDLRLSELCNIGLNLVNTKFFAFFSDDDSWIKGKGSKLIDFLERNPEIDIVVGSTIEIKEKNIRIRPSEVLKNNQDLFDYLYGNATLFSNKRYLGLQDAVIRNGVYPNFRNKLDVYEDLYWLSDAQQMGHKISCVEDVVSQKFPSMQRSSSRQNQFEVSDMYTEILKLNKDTADKYYIYHSVRAAIASGDVRMFKRLLTKRIKTIGITFGDLLILPIQTFTLMVFILMKNFRKKSK